VGSRTWSSVLQKEGYVWFVEHERLCVTTTLNTEERKIQRAAWHLGRVFNFLVVWKDTLCQRYLLKKYNVVYDFFCLNLLSLRSQKRWPLETLRSYLTTLNLINCTLNTRFRFQFKNMNSAILSRGSWRGNSSSQLCITYYYRNRERIR